MKNLITREADQIMQLGSDHMTRNVSLAGSPVLVREGGRDCSRGDEDSPNAGFLDNIVNVEWFRHFECL